MMFKKPKQLQLDIALEPENKPRTWALRFISLFTIGVLCLITSTAVYAYLVLTKPPIDFPAGERIVIEPGTSVTDIVRIFKEANVVRSELVLYLTLIAFHEPTDIKASSYRFSTPVDVFSVAAKLTEGDFSADLLRFVHYEGERAELIAERAELLLPDFDAVHFLTLALPLEGKLFPDTYLIPRTFTAPELVTMFTEAYESRIAPLRPAIAASGYSEDEVITLASILEREANTRQSKRIVAGILLKRLEQGMPLQVDASMEYVLEKPLNELTAADLDRDSEYNTYLYAGLTPTPIGNPGLDAIEAVLEPEPSPYLFYLTGRDGNFYYASTYRQHQANINTYLR